MSWKTAMLEGQVFHGPCCYVDVWDLSFQSAVRRVLLLPNSAARRVALDEIERAVGVEMRRRYERAIKKLWGRK